MFWQLSFLVPTDRTATFKRTVSSPKGLREKSSRHVVGSFSTVGYFASLVGRP